MRTAAACKSSMLACFAKARSNNFVALRLGRPHTNEQRNLAITEFVDVRCRITFYFCGAAIEPCAAFGCAGDIWDADICAADNA